MSDDPKYILLLNESLKNALPALGTKGKGRLGEKLEFLRAGLWDGGLRVKKLKGHSGRVVFEARFSKAGRMLFTLGRQDSKTVIYLWGLVRHDDVKRTTHNLFPENAPFLDFVPETQEDYAELVLDDLPDSAFSQEAIEARVPEDYGPQRWLILNDREWQRLRASNKTDDLELFLYLTEEQAGVLKTPPPVLLSGTAGSGKTTLAVYFLLRPGSAPSRKLFLTYHPFLRDFSQGLYNGLTAGSNQDQLFQRPDFYVFRDLLLRLLGSSASSFSPEREVRLKEFEAIFRNHRLYPRYDAELVWEEIRSIIKGAKPVLRLERFKSLSQSYLKGPLPRDQVMELKEGLLGLINLESLPKIRSFLQSRTGFPGLEALARSLSTEEALWQKDQGLALLEIHKILEKKNRDLSNPLMTYAEYIQLGRKRAPNFFYDRKDLYDIAVYYQDRLTAQGLWDEIDLCRRVLDQWGRRQDPPRFYDLVVCDEVQDFADIQLSLIFRLAKSPENLVLAGDTKQIINPSGFRWEEVRNKFYERGIPVPRLHTLRINFRCVGHVVKLANALLDLKQRLVGLTGSEVREDWKFNGRPPFLITALKEADILSRLPIRAAGQVILVRDSAEQARLKQILGTELVFTIQEAKGLEFDTVLLWKFSADPKAEPLWRRIRTGGEIDRFRQPHLRHEINLLYVAVTRARNTLIVYDPSAEVWELPGIRELVFETDDQEVLPQLWQRISSPEDWEKQGDYFMEREYFSAALECYKNADHSTKVELAQAQVFNQQKRFREAAPLFEKLGLWRQAGECFERSAQWEQALAVWERIKERERAALCRIALYEQQGQYTLAAEEWLKRKEIGKALENWKKAGDYGHLGEYLVKLKRYSEAAEAFVAAGLYDQAAVLMKKSKKVDRAADLYYQAGNWKEAAALYKRLKKPERLLECYLKGGDYYSAALLHEKTGDLGGAMTAFSRFVQAGAEQAAQVGREAEREQARNARIKAAVRLFALGRHRESADLFFKKGRFDLALPQFQALKDHEKTAECYYRLKDYHQAALEIESSDLPDRYERSGELLNLHLSRSGGRVEREELKLLREGEQLLAQGDHERALVRFKTVNAPDLLRQAFHKTGRDQEALEYYLADDDLDEANRYVDESPIIQVSPSFVQILIAKYLLADIHYSLRPKSQAFLAGILSRVPEQDQKQEWQTVIDQFVVTINFWAEEIPRPVLDFLLRKRHYHGLFEIVRNATVFKQTKKPAFKRFLADLKQSAVSENDPILMACHHFSYDRELFEADLNDLEITWRNYRLFGESRNHLVRAVDFLSKGKRYREAANLCRRSQNHRLEGQILEKLGAYSDAGRAYRDGRLYEEALRCYRTAGDRPGMARIYERMGSLKEALKIWRNLERQRDVARLEKKIGAKEGTRHRQLSLLDTALK